MIKIETHCHSKGGSGCAKASPEYIVKAYKDAGYGGIVITNHIHPNPYFNEYPGATHKEKMNYWLSLADEFKSVGEKAGLKIFMGAEVSVDRADGGYSECMLYGFDRSFICDNRALFYMSQEELFKIAEKNNLFMYQTHPYRKFISCCKPEFLHGAEAFNGHIGHENNNEIAQEFCKKYKLTAMSGTDFHEEGQAITGGIFIPDNINDDFALAQYLLNNKPKLFIDKKLYDEKFVGGA